MFQISRIHLLIILAVIVLFSSCTRSSKSAQYIPSNAVGVLSVDLGSLQKKALMSAIAGSPLLDMLLNTKIADSGIDLKESGIDLFNTFHVFTLPSREVDYYVIIPLSNSSQFENFLSKNYVQSQKESVDKLSMMMIDEGSCIAWNSNTAILAIGSLYNYYEEDDKDAVEIKLSLNNRLKSLFELTSKESITQNNKFTALQSASNDIAYWMNYEQATETLPNAQMGMVGPLLSMQKKYLKDMYLAGSINFEKGKVVSDGRYYYNKQIGDLYQKIMSGKVNNELLERVQGNQIQLLLKHHINPSGIKELMDTLGYSGLINMGLQEVGTTLEEALSSFSGDFLFSVADFALTPKPKVIDSNNEYKTSYTSPNVNMNAALSFKIGNKENFNKLMSIIASTGGMKIEEGSSNTYLIDEGEYILMHDNEYVSISNKRELTQSFFSGSNNTNMNYPKDLINHPIAFFVDLKSALVSVDFEKLMDSSSDAKPFNEIKNRVESISAYNGKPGNESADFHIELALQNKSDNSLAQILELLNQLKVLGM